MYSIEMILINISNIYEQFKWVFAVFTTIPPTLPPQTLLGHIYLYNILGGRPFHPSVLSSIHPSSSSRKKKMMEEEEEEDDDERGRGNFQNARFAMYVFMGDFSMDFRHKK